MLKESRSSSPGASELSRLAAGLALGTVLVLGSNRAHAQEAPPSPPAPEDAQEKTVCLNAHEEAQAARIARRFSEARTKLRACAREVCPGLVREDCVTWLGDLAKVFPSVIVDAYVDGQQATATRVYLDGNPIAEHLDGRTVEVDPGAHVFRFEVSGFPPHEENVVVAEGQQGRTVVAQFHHDLPAQPLATAVVAAAPRPIPATVWISGAVALAGIASTATFGALAMSEKSSLSQSCSPFCSDTQLGNLRGYTLAADVSVGVAAAAAALGGFLFLTRPERPSRPNQLSFSASPLRGSGGLLAARLLF
jgi:hypothetical protein